MLDALAAGSHRADSMSIELLQGLLYEWADIALRTLVFCKREIHDFEGWVRAACDACCACG